MTTSYEEARARVFVGRLNAAAGKTHNEDLRALLEAAADEIAKGALLSGWRDISTAPTDGTAVDVWLAPVSADGTPLLPCRVPNAYCSAESREDVWYVRGERTDHRIWGRITHWMPIPAPPSSAIQTAEAVPGLNNNPPPKGGE